LFEDPGLEGSNPKLLHKIRKMLNDLQTITEVTIMLDDYFRTNLGVKDLPQRGIEPQSPSPQPVVLAMSYNNPLKKVIEY